MYGCVYFVSVKAKQPTQLLKKTTVSFLYFTLWAQDHTLAIAYRLPKAAGPGPGGPQLWALGLGPGPISIVAKHMCIKGSLDNQ